MTSGECSVSGCKDGPPAGEGFMWSGPGCRVGKIILLSMKSLYFSYNFFLSFLYIVYRFSRKERTCVKCLLPSIK